jgi:hypothetical protein
MLTLMPQCLCCAIARQISTHTSPVVSPQNEAPEESGGCCACAKKHAKPTPAPAKNPTSPQPCPCSERPTLMPSTPPVEHVAVDAVCMAVLPHICSVPTVATFFDHVGWGFPPGLSCLHIIHCVWQI